MDAYKKLMIICGIANVASAYMNTDDPINEILLQSIADILGVQPPSPNNDFTVTFDELVIARKYGKIEAIKAYRERTKLGLKESKEAIEGAANKLEIPFKTPSY